MKREVTIEGKTYQVEFNNFDPNAPCTVKVDDKPVEMAFQSEPRNDEPFFVRFKGKKYTVELSRNSGQGSFTAKVNNVPFKIELKTSARQMIAPLSLPSFSFAQRGTRKTLDKGVVTAPMAGKIIKVKVKKGDAVEVGDVLCTLEAMKMENEVTAPTNGVVEEVLVQEGRTVNADDILILIK